MSDVRWEPVAGKCYLGFDDRDDYIRVHTDSNGAQMIEVAGEDMPSSGWVMVPPDVRLCRAVPVAWSQEPPTPDDEAEWWMWRPGMARPWRVIIHNTLLMHRVDTLQAVLHFIYDDAWYMPATIPMPPEVTP
jgi:hypothetical protein